MGSNLRPEPRVNIKGHVVVKHVRADSSLPQSASRQIPGPQAAPDNMQEAPLLGKLLKSRYPHFVKGTSASDFDTDAVIAVESLLEEAVSSGRTITRSQMEEEIVESFRLHASHANAGRAQFNQIAAFGKYAMWDYNNSVQNYLNGFKKYPEFSGVFDYFKGGTETQRQQAQGLVEFVSSFTAGPAAGEFIDFGYEGDDTGYEVPEEDRKVYIKDVGMRSLVMDHPTRVQEIINLMTSEGVTDAAHLRSMIEHGQQALRDGVL